MAGALGVIVGGEGIETGGREDVLKSGDCGIGYVRDGKLGVDGAGKWLQVVIIIVFEVRREKGLRSETEQGYCYVVYEKAVRIHLKSDCERGAIVYVLIFYAHVT